MIDQISLCRKILKHLASQGMKSLIFCAGSRNAPLLEAAKNTPGLRLIFHYEERAAAFMALGLMKAEKSPVGVVTTSGTAAAELLPALIEAHYSGHPLLAITADRPKDYRGTGAPQSIEQKDLFKNYVGSSFDFDAKDYETGAWKSVSIYCDRPLHVNLCFEEPLLQPSKDATDAPQENKVEPQSFYGESFWAQTSFDESLLKSLEKPLCILGSLSKKRLEEIAPILESASIPIYAEAHSNAFGLGSSMLIPGNSSCLQKDDFTKNFDSIVRIGGIPTLRLWRDLEKDLSHVPVFSLNDLPFSGLARESFNYPLSRLEEFLKKSFFSKPIRYSRRNLDKSTKVPDGQSIYSTSELQAFRHLKDFILRRSNQKGRNAHIYLGNSLVIREWDFIQEKPWPCGEVLSNRGANGIDGLIASASGFALSKKEETFLILGDLSALYDLSSLHLIVKENIPLNVVVINNKGGKIFSLLYQDKDYQNPHQLKFQSAAKMFGLKYLRSPDLDKDQKVDTEEPLLIELQVDDYEV